MWKDHIQIIREKSYIILMTSLMTPQCDKKSYLMYSAPMWSWLQNELKYHYQTWRTFVLGVLANLVNIYVDVVIVDVINFIDESKFRTTLSSSIFKIEHWLKAQNVGNSLGYLRSILIVWWHFGQKVRRIKNLAVKISNIASNLQQICKDRQMQVFH